MSAFDKLKELVAVAEADAAAFYTKGNKAAGTRLRKAFQDIKVAAQEGRAEVTELKNKESK
uniref:histone H1 n=1 Tax=Pedobacter schmidteae TaxID=2201271 RepID=UPI000EB19444|nr:histone H1 [Pedobacter schmidteae]